jgi:hypothetical protein
MFDFVLVKFVINATIFIGSAKQIPQGVWQPTYGFA